MDIDQTKKCWGREFSDEQIAEARKNGRLLSMELETSHICNLRCIYCYNNAGKKLENELTLEQLFSVIQQGVDLGVQRVILIGGGEPMMHPNVMEIIGFLNGKNLAIDLFTNGTLITADVAKRLYDWGVEPVVKLNSLKPEVQDYLVDCGGAYQKIQSGIENLMQAGYPDADHEMGIETIICAQNFEEIPDIWRWARDRKIIPYMEMITFQGRAKERHELNVPVESLHQLFDRLAEIDREEYDYHWKAHPPVAGLSCARHEYSCTITANGYVQPCTGVDIKVGNVCYDSLQNILAGSPVVQSLRNVRENIKGACETCDQLPECYGCRGMAYHLTGDYLAADPLCWRNPNHLKICQSNPRIEK